MGMKTVSQHLRKSVLNKDKTILDIVDLRESEWSVPFENLMRNRLIFGAFRYGKLLAEGKPRYDRMSSIIKRAEQYKVNGNTELLVDIANLCLLEFEEGIHPNKHFKAVDDGEHVEVIES